MRVFLGFLSSASMLVSIVLALLLVFSKSEGGFFPGLGNALALLVLLGGVTLSFVFNILFWCIYGAPLWLKVVVAIQVLPAAYCIFGVVSFAYKNHRETKASNQRFKIREAIRQNDLQRFLTTQRACKALCRDRYSVNDQLLDAVDNDSQAIARYLIDHDKANAKLDLTAVAPHTSLRTCEDVPLGDIQILPLAVARHNVAMTRLLLPVSDANSRRGALWLAAKLDRLDMVQLLLENGTPIDIRGELLDENQTLVHAAASGAAVNTGRWLIEEKHMPVNAVQGGPDPYTAVSPLSILFENVDNVNGMDPSRVRAFLKLLMDHGAAVDAPSGDGKSLLQQAIHTENQQAAHLLVDAGAKTEKLSPEEKESLTHLLSKTNSTTAQLEPLADCIAVGQPDTSSQNQ